ncbi:hypothetical protein [Streptomyces sp. NPDC001315]|uniref:hypothetical protein n=1 Tax=Streptomyces sp. NPDC001315 TaxID=3364562 RepID=UPI00369488E9
MQSEYRRQQEGSIVEMRLEAVVIPVSDVDRSKGFYEALGWRPDADFAAGDGFRLVQLTPPGSAWSWSRTSTAGNRRKSRNGFQAGAAACPWTSEPAALECAPPRGRADPGESSARPDTDRRLEGRA